jgi:hypothetical protein
MKKIIFAVLASSFMLSFSTSNAEDIGFPNYSSQVSHLELDLKLFDFAVNHLHIFSEGPLSKLSSISSHAFTNKRIDCWVHVSSSIMEGTLTEKKKRLNEFCNALFVEYQERFTMMDLNYQKKPGEVGQPGLQIKPSNLKIYIHTSGLPSIFLADWESGTMSYKDGFLSNY